MPSCIAERSRKPRSVRAAIAARLRECGLELHPEKTKGCLLQRMRTGEGRIRTRNSDFLGYTFRPRWRSKNHKGKHFINFSPAVSDKAVKAIRAEIRGWNLHLRSDKSNRGSVADVQPDHPRVASVLRAVLPVGALSADASIGSITGPLGSPEIQEAARPFAQGRHIGSRVSRDALNRSCGRTGRWEVRQGSMAGSRMS